MVGWVIGVLFAIFYSQKLRDFDDWPLIRAGRLIKVRLCITRRYISKSGQPLIFGEERKAMKLPRWKEMRGQTFVISIAKINRQAEAAKY